MSELQTPPEGTEQELVTPHVDPEPETPQTPSEETVPQEPTEQPSPPAPPGFVPKDKFIASAQESILNAERVKVRDARLEQLTKTDTPTDEVMRQLYPEWDNLDEYNKRVLIKTETIAMQTAANTAKQQEIDARQKLEDQLDDVIDNSDYSPKLKGKETDFKRFARNPKNRGIAAETLAKAFLFDAEETPAPPTPMPEALPTGSGGPREPLTPKKISSEEARELRKNNYKEWKRLLDAGMLEDEI